MCRKKRIRRDNNCGFNLSTIALTRGKCEKRALSLPAVSDGSLALKTMNNFLNNFFVAPCNLMEIRGDNDLVVNTLRKSKDWRDSLVMLSVQGRKMGVEFLRLASAEETSVYLRDNGFSMSQINSFLNNTRRKNN